MRQTWSELLFLHWRCDPATLQTILPAGLHLDTCDGSAWIGVVPFRMDRIRPAGLFAVPWLSWFLELNVRTYVHDDEGRPGVWFHSLDANRWPACKIGRTAFRLPYFHARMSSATSPDGWTDYRCHRLGEADEAHYRYRPDSTVPAREAEAGSLEFFLLERYLLFSHNPGTGRLFSGQVHHRPYRYRPADAEICSLLPTAWDGIPGLAGAPAHACAAEAVDVEVFALKAVP